MKMRETSRDTDKKPCVNNYLTWANQVRLLQLNIQSLASTIGQGLIAAVLPAIQAINALFSVLMRAAEAFRNFMYALTGYEGKGSQGGIINEFAGIGDVSTGLEDIGSSGGDAADGMDDASSAAKKLKKSLSVLSFDQLHQLSDAADDAADALGNASGAGGGLDDINVPGSGISGLGNISDAISKSELPKAVNEWAERIRKAFLNHDWEGLGKEIAWGLNKGLQYIYDAISWENVGPKITAFTTAFTETFNSLVNNFDWELLGRTIGAGINTIVNSLNQLADGIDWENLGKQISDGFNGLFDEVDWNNLGHLIGNKFRIAWDLFGGFVKNLKFDKIGTSVAEGLNSAFSTISFGDIADYLATALNGAFTSLASFAETFKWDDLVDNISNGIITFIESFEWEENGQRLNTFLTNLLGALKQLAEKIPWEELGQKIGEFISEIDWPTILYDIGTIIAEALGGIFSGLEESGTAGKILSWLIKVFAAIKVASPVLGLVNKISKFLTGSSSKGILSYAFDGLFSKSTEGATKGLGGLSGALGKVKDFLPKLSDSAIWTAGIMDTFKWSLDESKKAANIDDYMELSSAMLQLKDSGLVTSEQFDDMYGVFVEAQNSAKPVEDAIELLKQKLEECGVSSEVFQSAIDGSLDELQDTVPKKSATIGSGISKGISDGVNASKETTKKSITDSIGEAFDSLGSVFEGLGSWFSEQWNKISGVFSKAPDDFKKWFSDAYENVQDAWSSVGNWFSGKWDSIKKVFTSAPATFKNWFQTAYTNVKNIWTPVNTWFSGKWSAIKSVFSPVASTFKGWFQNAYTNVQNIWAPVNSWFSSKWSSIKTVFSPVATTFKGWFQSAYTNVKNIWNPVNTWFSGKWSSVKNVFGDVTSFFKNGFQSAYNAVTNIFGGLGSFFKSVANNAFSPIKSLVNGIVSGVNWVLEKLGSKTRLSSWGGVNFAKGSRGLERDTLGIVNDQKGATYKELIVPPNGKPFIPKGRNVMLPLQKGTKIMPAKQTKELMKSMGIRHFAGGIGDFFGSAWSAIKSFTGEVWDYLTHPEDLIKIAIDKFTNISGLFEPWLSIAGGVVNQIIGGATSFIKKIFDSVTPKVNYSPSAGVEQWRGVAAQALRMEGQYSESNLNRLLMQMQTESSGNPNAINNWDINAKRGTPSKGLMQVIDPTFRAYARPGYDKNIWDPLSNILASIRYTVRRYGSLANGWRGHAYAEGIGRITLSDILGDIPFLARGGIITAPTLALTGENFRKEAVLPLENRRSMQMIANSIVENSDGLGLTHEELAQTVAEGVAMAMMNNSGNQPNITVYAELKTESDEVLARAVTRGQNKLDYRKNPTAQFGY